MPVRLVPIRWFHLRRLRRWRGIPNHLRHPGIPSWPHHLRWWWRTKHDPTLWMRAVVDAETGELRGSAGLVGRQFGRAEASVLCVRDTRHGESEDFTDETDALELVWLEGPTHELWVEVYSWAPRARHAVFSRILASFTPQVFSDYPTTLGATLYRRFRDA